MSEPIEAPYSHNALHHQYQLGVINRATRELISSQSYLATLAIIEQLLADLSLSGFIHISGFQFNKAKKIGSGLPRNRIRDLLELMQQPNKISVSTPLFVFKWPSLTVVVDASHSADPHDDQLQDDLAMFIDSAQLWMNQHFHFLETKSLISEKLGDFKFSITSDLRILTAKRESLIHKLLGDMVSIMPMMGLEPDQEEEILNTLQPVIDSMEKSLSEQSTSNQDFIQIINQLLSYLNSTTEPPSIEADDDHDASESITLF
jgi:hypothetical protein